MSEFDRIARLSRRFGAPRPPAVGIGHDCALLPSMNAWTAISVDASVEGVHFTREWLSLDQAAERAVEAALSDLAAAGASASGPGTGILSALAVPPELTDDEFDALIEGIARTAERVETTVIGGNLTSASLLSITTTVLGRVDGPRVTRSGARVGDLVVVTGCVGAAGLGLAALRAGYRESDARPFVERWTAPRARLAEGAVAARFATAMVDVSDGLAADLGHLCEQSNCAAILDVESLPVLAGHDQLARRLGCDGHELALSGGEDYELCFTVASRPPWPLHLVPWTVVGHVVEGSGVFVRSGGQVAAYRGRGWDHFR